MGNLEIGDVIFFKAENTWISKLISKLTHSPYTHVGLAIGKNHIIEANRFVNTRIVRFDFDGKKHAVYRLQGIDDKIRDKIYAQAMVYNNYPYDYLQILGLFFRYLFRWKKDNLFNRANRLICSELIDYTFYYAGVNRKRELELGDITPSMLLELYDLKKVRGE